MAQQRQHEVDQKTEKEVEQMNRDEQVERQNQIREAEEERIREELSKCFSHDSSKTFKTLQQLDREGLRLAEWIFDNTDIWLNPTNKK